MSIGLCIYILLLLENYMHHKICFLNTVQKKIVISLTMKTSCLTMDFGLEKLIFEYSFNKSIFLVRISV